MSRVETWKEHDLPPSSVDVTCYEQGRNVGRTWIASVDVLRAG